MTRQGRPNQLVFDADEWRAAGCDWGDNSRFYHEAEVISDDGETATVKFLHNGKISRGQFLYAMKDIPLPPCEWCGSTFHGHYPNCPDLED